MNAINKTTGEAYETKFNKDREIEREGLSGYIENGVLMLTCDQISTLKNRGWLRGKIETKTASNWREEPATQAQLSYLNDLGANITSPLTKSEASTLISSMKRGDGCGYRNTFKFDGSN